MKDSNKFREAVCKELTAMKETGMRVPMRAFNWVEELDLNEFEEMSVAGVAELCIELTDNVC